MIETETVSSIHHDIARVLISEDEIQNRVALLGQQIARDYAGRPPVLIGVLKGSAVFLADLMRKIHLPCVSDFICLSSYVGHESSGVVRMILDLRESVEGKDLLLVEDIIDTGLTANFIYQNLKLRDPRSIEICTLLDKPECRQLEIDAKYVGFKIPNEFVVGYGLDFNERYRNLPYIGILKPEARRGF
jgi:hypoxanthine phosphoribosyltransferase